MAMTSKLRADYIEMINSALDEISINTVEDFDAIISCLNSIINPQVVHVTRQDLEEAKESIAEYLNSPESFVRNSEDYAEYQQIVRDRINAKINEFAQMSQAQKQAYIAEQQHKRTVTEHQHQEFRVRTPPAPGSEAHVMSVQQMFQQPFASNVIANLNGVLTRGQYESLSLEKKELIANNIHATQCLIRECQVNFEQIHSLDYNEFRLFIEKAIDVERLVKEANIPFVQILALNIPIRSAVLNRSNGVVGLINRVGVPLQTILDLDPRIRSIVLRRPDDVIRLVNEVHISFNDIASLNPTTMVWILDKSVNVKILVNENDIPFTRLVELEEQALRSLLTDINSQQSQSIIAELQAEQGNPPRRGPTLRI